MGKLAFPGGLSVVKTQKSFSEANAAGQSLKA